MAVEPDSAATSRDARDLDEADTLTDGEWPVAEEYRVEPADQDTNATAVSEPAHARPRMRGFPPDVPRGVVAGLLAALLVIPAVLLAAALLRDDGEPQAAAGTRTTPVDTTAAASSRPRQPTAGTLPDTVGLPLDEARSRLEELGFRVRVRTEASERPEEEVLRQAPRAGTEVERDAVVTLTVSGGVERIVVPDVEGVPVDDARRALRRVGLQPEIRLVRSDEPEGTVLVQTPSAGGEVDPERVVRLQVAQAAPEPARVEVPDVLGLSVADARARLRELGLRSTTMRVASSEPSGTVIRQSPAAGAELRDGATVRLRVSAGPSDVAIPDVTGLDEQSARRQLEAAGFTVEVVDQPTDDPAQDGLVLSQAPAGGTRSERGALVTLTVARGG